MNKWNNFFDEAQRIQVKVFICVLGLLLLGILFLGKIIFPLLHNEKEPEEEHVPVIEVLTNVWIMEADAEKMLVFQDGQKENYYYGETELPWEKAREQVADITLTDGRISAVVVKNEKINGRLLSADENGIELEEYGKIPLASDYKGYRIYNTLEMCAIEDLPFGYNYADFILADGEVQAVLLAKEDAMEYIRVLIKASDYSALLHEQIILTADCDFTIQYGAHDNLQVETHLAGEEIVFDRDSIYFAQGRVCIVPNVITGKISLQNVNRSQGVPCYRGQMELVSAEEGIAVINEVTLEEYLYSVVPSEMPSAYPGQALKAQAVCARTYAYGHMLHAGYPKYGAHVDDSTSYQVYNNIIEQESTTTAVKETYGNLLFTDGGDLAGTYYYSTSCGMGSDANVWKTSAAQSIAYLRAKELNKKTMEAENTADSLENPLSEMSLGEALREEELFYDFIMTKNEDDFEISEGWYRWRYLVETVNTESILATLQKRFQANEKLVLTMVDGEYVSKPIEKLGKITGIYIEKRGAGGVADELIIETKDGTIKVISEHNIRYVLNNGESKIVRQDGTEIASPNLLPSGFFVIETVMDGEYVAGYQLTGGGFGHGVGMSQNGAKNMANCGYGAEQILLFFYENCYIDTIYE